jgi:hypothetical protein
MRGTKLYTDFVLQREDCYISINSSHLSSAVGLLRRRDWAFARPAGVEKEGG